ncbi:Hint domain-containing protein [Thioclava sp. 'Guangxiensis']|uniref:Hint domain-containing protein n=1 Tax=Thioclava sp. 'Guangxiensis' TaxID=3149044 RepID=UPI0038781CC7
MAIFDLNFFDLSYASTTAATFADNGGYQFNLGVDTITLSPSSTSSLVQVDDVDNTTFDDDNTTQTLANDYTLNGIFYAAGTEIESEYEVTVQDSFGNNYVLQFVSLNNDAWNIQGFIIQGTPPPYGEALTVVGRQDMTYGSYAYSTSTPSCFGPKTRILMADGRERPAEALRSGDRLRLADGSVAPVIMVLRARVPLEAGGNKRPIRIQANALGEGLPRQALILSAQHRIYLTDADALAPAVAFLPRPKVGRIAPLSEPYVHIVLRCHSLIVANGLPCESFWPGPVALSLLPGLVARRIKRIMGQAPTPAKPLLRMRNAQGMVLQALARELSITLPRL